MKHIPTVAGILLGLLFLFASAAFFFNLVEAPPPPEGSHSAVFMSVFAPSGYLAFVKTFEAIGGILVAIPRTRNFGLLILGPIIINVLAFHTFVTPWTDLINPLLIIICLLAAYLLYAERKAFANLITRNS
ncbi:MAG TPA: hypothetical protein VD994_14250 [Prosthecobacter sp.]|nr:hypothetical protein [Prosthecobacter sp.]